MDMEYLSLLKIQVLSSRFIGKRKVFSCFIVLKIKKFPKSLEMDSNFLDRRFFFDLSSVDLTTYCFDTKGLTPRIECLCIALCTVFVLNK